MHIFVEKIGTLRMSKSKPYKKPEMNEMSVGEPIIDIAANVQNHRMPNCVRDDVRRAISGEELLNRLRPRIKELFQ